MGRVIWEGRRRRGQFEAKMNEKNGSVRNTDGLSATTGRLRVLTTDSEAPVSTLEERDERQVRMKVEKDRAKRTYETAVVADLLQALEVLTTLYRTKSR
jgi:hypothetical protein